MEQIAKKGLSRDFIKYLAAFTMLLNHIAGALLPQDTLLFEIFEDIGYFTAVTMCYFLVEGFGYTRSRKKYGQRLLLFGIISQGPFCLALGYFQFDMMFSLFLCLLLLCVREDVKSKPLKVFLIILIIAASLFCDWALFAPVFTLMFAASGDSVKKKALSFGAAALMFGAVNFGMYLSQGAYSAGEAVLHAALAMCGIICSGIVILCFYSGKRSERARTFSKWFFYVFYPAHLLILGILRIAVI